MGESIPLLSGVRQGSILAPILFAVYVDELLSSITDSGLGCHVKHIPLNIFMYADDLILSSSSVHDLQKMVNICTNSLESLNMKINEKKSICIKFGPSFVYLPYKISIASSVIPWSNKLRYLGSNFIAGRHLCCDLHPVKAKFFGALNAIFGKLGPSPPIHVALSLVFSKCSPILLYGLESLNISKAQQNNIDYI